MPDSLLRLAVLILVSLITCIVVWYGRRFVEIRRQRVLTAASISVVDKEYLSDSPNGIRILAFTSATCHQCHKLQMPALHRLVEHYGADISIEEVDAPTSPELTQRYQVFTVPTTVVLDATGRAHAINYGFANTQLLLEQVDEVLAEIAS